jgi:hypothetical protein
LLATAYLQTHAIMFPADEHTVSGSRSLLLMGAVADHSLRSAHSPLKAVLVIT